MAILRTEHKDIVDVDARDRWSFSRYLLIGLAVVYALIALDIADGNLVSGDTDDLMRKLEIRNFVDGAGWFDLSFPSVRMPEIYVTPWSRLVDLPYALITWMLQPITGRQFALDIAFHIWPPIMAAFYALGVVGILARLVPAKRDLPVPVLLTLLMPSAFAIWEFSPGRVDHHNVQILLLLALVYGLSRWDRLGGAIAGTTIPASMAVGLEALPVLAASIAVVCGAWIFGAKGSTAVLRAVALSTMLSAISLMLVVIEPHNYLFPQNDAFSAPYVMALVGFGIVASWLTRVFGGAARPVPRGAALFAGGLAVSVAILWRYPSMLEGPLPMIKGLAELYWFDRINLEKGVVALLVAGDKGAILHLLAGAIIVLAAPKVLHALRSGQIALPAVFVVICAAFITACFSVRFLRIALCLIPLLLPVAMAMLRSGDYATRTRQTLVAGLITLFAATGVWVYFLRPAPVGHDAFDYLVMDGCDGRSLASVQALPPGRMMTPPALGLRIVSDDPGRISVSSVSFHRSSASISNVLAVMMSLAPSESAVLLKDFDYIAICRIPTGLVNEEKLPLLARLLAGSPVPGLVPITGPGDAIMIFRIDHEALR